MQIGGLFSRVGACKHSPKSPTCSKNIGKLSKVPTLAAEQATVHTMS